MVRISDGSGYLERAQEVVDKLKVGGNEVKSVNGVGLVVDRTCEFVR